MAILTISREFGSGGREVGQAVANRLGYAYVKKSVVLKPMGEQGKSWGEWAKGLDEHSPTIWERYDWSFRGFAALVKSTLLEYAAADNAILMERGGNFLMASVPHAYRIRVVAPLDSRLERIMIRESVDYDTALWLTEKTDRDRSEFIRALYHKDWSDPLGYDAVFDTGLASVDEVIDVCCDTLNKRNEFKRPDVEKDLQLRASAAKLEAGLVTYPFLFVNTLEVMIEGDQLVLTGIVRDPKQKKRVEDVARKLAGSAPLSLRLHYRAE